MILVVGLTPAWQQIARFEKLQLGEVNRALEVNWLASGKSINVAVALSSLGAQATSVAPLGGSTGKAIERSLETLKVGGRWIETGAITRVCTTILDGASGQTTELVQNAGAMTPEELAALMKACREEGAKSSLAVVTGSLPAGAPQEFYRDLLAAIGLPTILDARGPELFSALDSQPLVVKPNRRELAETSGRTLSCEDDVRGAMEELVDRGAQNIVVTDGAEPVLMTSSEGSFRARPPKVDVVNPIGCGDCLAAGLAWGLSQQKSLVESLRLGMAAAAESAAQLLPARIDPEKVLKLAESIRVEQL